MRKLLFLCLRLSGIPLILRLLLQRKGVTILCYHDPAPEVLDIHLRNLKTHYNFISLRQYIEWRSDRSRKRLPPYAMVLTLDDGHRGNAALGLVLVRHNVKPTIFLCSALVGTNRHFWWLVHDDYAEMVRLTRVPDGERLRRLADVGFLEDALYQERQSLSREEIDALKVIVDFQSHTRFHPILPACAIGRVKDEIVGSKTELENNFGLATYALAFPNGDYSEREIAIAKEASYTCALTLGWGYNNAQTPLFQLRRLPISDDADKNELLVKASGLWSFIERIFPRRPHGYMQTYASAGDVQRDRAVANNERNKR
jgi:peptidoglycan/xylan/chitin deacetylase (PgdA/CDA1 family)